MNKKTLLLVIIFCFTIEFCLNAQILTVDKDENIELKETKFIFTSTNQKKHIDIYRITRITTGDFFSYSYSGSYYGREMEFICTTPAELKLDKGQMVLQAGSGLLTKEFIITATGGTQEISIRPGNIGLMIGGLMLMSFGILGLSTGLLMTILCGLETTSPRPNEAMIAGLPGAVVGLVAGTIVTGGSIPMMICAYPKVTLLSIKF